MNIFLHLSPKYKAYKNLLETLKLCKLEEVCVSTKLAVVHYDELAMLIQKLTIIETDFLYDFLLNSDLMIICTDGEDEQTENFIRYAVKHKIPILILHNFSEGWHK